MFTKTSFALLLLQCFFYIAPAQILDLGENAPATENGIEYGYLIRNEQVKASKGEEYSRFEITLYMTNKSGCTKLYADRKSFTTNGESPNLLATYLVNNANGKRLTAKSGTIKARDFYVNVKVKENDKEESKSVKAGFIFRNGETLKSNIIVLVPKDDRPSIQCSVATPYELQ